MGTIFGLGRSLGEENGNPLQYSCLENPMDRGALWATVHGFTKELDMTKQPITSWEIDGETMETVSDFILGGSKITAHGDCSHEIKRRLLLGRKVMTT